MPATKNLRDEHKMILLVMDACEREAKRIEETGDINTGKIDKMVDFFKGFIDRCHHTKEEKHLFPTMQKMDIPSVDSPISVMLEEHGTGRSIASSIANLLIAVKKGDKAVIDLVKDAMQIYVQLLRAHIGKEDNILYPMYEQATTTEVDKNLEGAFEIVERDEMGEGTHEKYHQLAHELAVG